LVCFSTKSISTLFSCTPTTFIGEGFPLTLELIDPKLPKKSWVKISQIRTLSVKRIGKMIARGSEEELALIIDGLNEIIGG